MISLNFSFIHYMSYNVSHGLKITFFLGRDKFTLSIIEDIVHFEHNKRGLTL